MEFTRELPNDAACLEWLWRNRYSEDGSHAYCPKCDRERKFHKVRERPAWDCERRTLPAALGLSPKTSPLPEAQAASLVVLLNRNANSSCTRLL